MGQQESFGKKVENFSTVDREKTNKQVHTYVIRTFRYVPLNSCICARGKAYNDSKFLIPLDARRKVIDRKDD